LIGYLVLLKIAIKLEGGWYVVILVVFFVIIFEAGGEFF
jgi:hypothetical protein